MKTLLFFSFTVFLCLHGAAQINAPAESEPDPKPVVKTKPVKPMLSAGEAVIQYANGDYSSVLRVVEACETLGSNQKLFLGPGRAQLYQELKINNVRNIEIIGNRTELVTRINTSVMTLKDVNGVVISGILAVHEIGEDCSQNCLNLELANNVEVKNCRFNGSGVVGLSLYKATNIIVTNNEFFNCVYGFGAYDSQEITLRNNSFYENRSENITLYGNYEQIVNDYTLDNDFSE